MCQICKRETVLKEQTMKDSVTNQNKHRKKNVLFLVLTGTNKHNTVQKHKELAIYITNRIANYTTNHILKEKIRAIKDQQ